MSRALSPTRFSYSPMVSGPTCRTATLRSPSTGRVPSLTAWILPPRSGFGFAHRNEHGASDWSPFGQMASTTQFEQGQQPGRLRSAEPRSWARL